MVKSLKPKSDPNPTHFWPEPDPKSTKNWETKIQEKFYKSGFLENLEFIDGKIISKEKISLTVTNL